MNLLAVETSCDETAAAILDGERRILGSVVLSQDEVHAPYRGVVPELASRQHLKSIGWVVEECLNRAGLTLPRIDAFAVTQGPGLIGSLLVGLSFVKGLAYFFRKPLIGIDHLEAHMEAAFLERPGLSFPCLALVVSGGHTSLFFLKKRFLYKLIGRTRDDAAGEALDKVAKFLDLGYPGGPVIQKLAENGNGKNFRFSPTRMKDDSLDFSFSGLKSAALKKIRETGMSKSHPGLADFLAAFEEAIARAVLDHFARAAEIYKPHSLVISGGVARNKRLRTRFLDFAREQGLDAFVPSPPLCTDNAVMVGSLAVEKLKAARTKSGTLDLDAYPRFNP